jgi:hypothetical protein
MDTLLHRFGALIKGSIKGFDRIVFIRKSSLNSICSRNAVIFNGTRST